MQTSLFGELEDLAKQIEPAASNPKLITLAQALPPQVRLGTSSWSCPGWTGLVWNRDYSETHLSRYGLTAYNKHPLLRTVCIDHGFYEGVPAARFAEYASQVEDDFRFVVKAPQVITDVTLRDQSGRAARKNPTFLSHDDAMKMFVEPVLEGLGHKLGALVFQIGPLPDAWLNRIPELIKRLHTFLDAIPDFSHIAPEGILAVEVRNAAWLIPEFAQMLKDTGATYCLGLHAKMPFIDAQLDVLRHLFPGPLVCRWNLHPANGAYGYEDASQVYSPYNKIVDADVKARVKLAKVIAATANANQKVYVAVSNKAEGCAPLSIVELAKAIHASSTVKR